MGKGSGSGGAASVSNGNFIRSTPGIPSNASIVSDTSGTIHLPLPDRFPPVGLMNLGNTCYANAALQCLLSTALSRALLEPQCFKEFKRYSSNPHLLEDSTFDHGDIDVSSPRRFKKKQKISETCRWITKEVTYLCRTYTADPEIMQKRRGTFCSYFIQPDIVLNPGSITLHVNRLSPCLRIKRQEDAHEFLRALITNLCMDGQNKKLSALFDGLLESAVTCQTCGHSSLTRDRYMDLSLEINGNAITDLQGALRQFTKTEYLSPDNMVECERCKVKRRVTKGLRLATAPSVLVFHLKRFAFDIFGRMKRLNKKINFPLRLEIGEFMSKANRSTPPAYELVAVLVHQGRTCNSGHYLAYVRSEDDWYRANDDKIEKVPVTTVLAQHAYILVYEVEGMRKHKIRNPKYDLSTYSYDGQSMSTYHQIAYGVDEDLPTTQEDDLLSSMFQSLSTCGGISPDIIDCCGLAPPPPPSEPVSKGLSTPNHLNKAPQPLEPLGGKWVASDGNDDIPMIISPNTVSVFSKDKEPDKSTSSSKQRHARHRSEMPSSLKSNLSTIPKIPNSATDCIPENHTYNTSNNKHSLPRRKNNISRMPAIPNNKKEDDLSISHDSWCEDSKGPIKAIAFGNQSSCASSVGSSTVSEQEPNNGALDDVFRKISSIDQDNSEPKRMKIVRSSSSSNLIQRNYEAASAYRKYMSIDDNYPLKNKDKVKLRLKFRKRSSKEASGSNLILGSTRHDSPVKLSHRIGSSLRKAKAAKIKSLSATTRVRRRNIMSYSPV